MSGLAISRKPVNSKSYATEQGAIKAVEKRIAQYPDIFTGRESYIIVSQDGRYFPIIITSSFSHMGSLVNSGFSCI